MKVTWKTPACPVDIKMYFIYYRKVIRTGSDGNRWNKVNVSSRETQYDLQLESFTEYEIAVTVSANEVLPSTLWRVRTEGGRQVILTGDAYTTLLRRFGLFTILHKFKVALNLLRRVFLNLQKIVSL